MSSSADRMRHHRERQRSGLIVIPIEICEFDVADALTTAGFLEPALQDDRGAIAEAIERLLDTLARSS